MALEIRKVQHTGFVADEKLWISSDRKIVRDGDYRAWILIAPKGGIIPEKLAIRLGLDKGIKVEPLEKQAPKPKTISTEDIAGRSTRPERPSDNR